MPTNEYVEVRNGGYYVAGTRIGLDVVVYDFRRGRSAEAIFEAYPSLGSLARVYGVITFMLEHPAEVEAYLKDQDRLLEEIKAQYPMPQDRKGAIDRLPVGGRDDSRRHGRSGCFTHCGGGRSGSGLGRHTNHERPFQELYC